jgi:hypothetical protein
MLQYFTSKQAKKLLCCDFQFTQCNKNFLLFLAGTVSKHKLEHAVSVSRARASPGLQFFLFFLRDAVFSDQPFLDV